MKTDAEWDKAYAYLQETRMNYTEIGEVGLFALTLFINPLLVRYSKGERTDELYDEIMSCS